MSTTEQTNLPKALIEDLAEAVIFADRHGVIQLWNHIREPAPSP